MSVERVVRVKHLANFRLVVSQVIEGNEAAEGRHLAGQHVPRFALVELSGTVRGDAFQGGGEFGLTEGVSHPVHLSVAQEDAATHRETFEPGTFLGEFPLEFLADRKSLFCQPGIELLFDRPRFLPAESDPTTVLDGALLTLNCEDTP